MKSQYNNQSAKAALEQAKIVLRERGYGKIEDRDEQGCAYLVATDDSGRKAEAYPRKEQHGYSYRLYEG